VRYNFAADIGALAWTSANVAALALAARRQIENAGGGVATAGSTAPEPLHLLQALLRRELLPLPRGSCHSRAWQPGTRPSSRPS